MRWRCDGCRKSFNKVPLAPMLNDAVWYKLADEREILCFQCMLERATKWGVNLSLASLFPCPFNLADPPRSWFDLFASTEKRPPSNIGEWRRLVEAEAAQREKIAAVSGETYEAPQWHSWLTRRRKPKRAN